MEIAIAAAQAGKMVMCEKPLGRNAAESAKMVEAVEHVTFSGQRARQLGQNVLYITERCVMRLTETGLVATEIMPGIDAARDIVSASGGRVRVAPGAITLPLSLLADAPMGWGK